MVKTCTLTLRRQWTDKLQQQQLMNALPSGVNLRFDETKEREVVLESSRPSDVYEAERTIKRLVIEQMVGSDSSVQAESNGLEKAAHEMDQEREKQQQQEVAPVDGETTSGDDYEEDGRSRPRTVMEERSRKAGERKEARRIAQKQEMRAGPQSEQRRGPARYRQRAGTSSEGFESGSDDSHGKIASVKSETVNASDAAQESSDRDALGMQAMTIRDEASGDSRRTDPVREQRRQVEDNVSETSVSQNDDVSPAPEKYRIDEPLWAYILFIDSQSQWHKKFAAFFDRKQGDEMVELTGSSADMDSLKKFCDRSRLKRSMKREMQRVPEPGSSAFLSELRKLSSGNVLVRMADDRHYCELIGKKSDVDVLRNRVDMKYPQLSDAKDSDKQPKTPAEIASVASLARSDTSSEYHSNPQVTVTRPNSDDGFQFCTPASKLMVKVLTGDLVKQRCEILVNPSNSYLHHHRGLSKLIADAAGSEMERECQKYLYKYRILQTSKVLDTTAGKMKSPVRRVIHACGPNVRDISDINRCGELLEWTFFHCFMLANDKHARSMAVPAISSGLSFLLRLID